MPKAPSFRFYFHFLLVVNWLRLRVLSHLVPLPGPNQSSIARSLTRRSERLDFLDQVGCKWFQNISADLYILCIYYLSRMHLSYAAVKRFIVVLRWLSLQRAGQTTMQNINNYDWDCHIHNIIMRTLIIKLCEFLEFSCCVSARCCVKNASIKGVHSEPRRHVHDMCIQGTLCR